MSTIFIRNQKGQFTNALPPNADEVVKNFTQRVLNSARKNLGDKANGTLGQSLMARSNVSGVKLEIEFIGEDYAPFYDKGVRGAGGYKGRGGNRGQGSPFKFGTGSHKGTWGKFRNSITTWMQKQGITKGRDTTTGRFITFESFRFLIMRAIYQRGLRTTNFFTNAFKLHFAQFKKDLQNNLIEDIDKLINNNFKKD